MNGFVVSAKATSARAPRKRPAVPRERWLSQLSWRVARLRGVLVHALAGARENARGRVDDLECRAAFARARALARLRREAEAWFGLGRPTLATASAAGLGFLVSGSTTVALVAGAWTFTVALLLLLRSSQRREVAALKCELQELKQLLYATQARLLVECVEDAEDITYFEGEQTRAARARKTPSSPWHRRLGLHWRTRR